MSINRRTAIAVRSIGVASAAAALALGLAGNAFACKISEFTPSAGCDNAGHGYISVVDKDYSQTPVDITLKQGGTDIGTKKGVVGSQAGVTVTFTVEWKPSTTYTVEVVKSSGEFVGDTPVTTPDTACQVKSSPTPSPSTSAPTTAPATTPPTTTAPAPVAATSSNAPSQAAGGGQKLAETGGGSNTGMIAGIAGALVVVGGGAVFGLRRRSAAARH